ncbi:uncharacterized protein Tco025E_05015 [Trypanosoma conorhini]|uniref:Uncharacterized protein n=1 Tax=Trypanosoma conorhini TaxID=83891 RepID=A0A3R7L619_9TRYP|nr:uncharacterized protein Tco025E_05015 [Trypanosoma conorhini]RNF16919.1 hypothetical protein Tco025E_05015 [Trypanosoma conorhini]
MTKDRINFRRSMKHAHGAAEVEDAVGITELRTTHIGASAAEERGLRVTGLMKWSFDDFIVEEVWPDGVLHQLQAEARETRTTTAFLIRVVSEGVPDSAIAALIEGKCPHRTSIRFLTPVDFVCCQERFVLVHSSSHEASRFFQRVQKVHLAEGPVCLGKAVDVPFDEKAAPSLPIQLLPDLRCSILLRGMRGSLADVLPRLEGLAKHGFLNYSHLARHGTGLFRAFESGRHLLHRDYVEFLRGHVLGLTERSPLLRKETPSLLELLANPKSTRRDWVNVRQGLEYALRRDEALIRRPQTGLYYPHHTLLRDFIERASDIVPTHHDSAQLIRESVPRLLLQEKIRSVADVHFNALASLRWSMRGAQVAVGDLVISEEETGPLDIFEAPADHMNGEMTSVRHPEWLSAAGENYMRRMRGMVHVVQSPEEGRRFSLEQVVLPVMGSGGEEMCLPGGRMKEAAERLAQEMQIEGLPKMKAAPPATYRRLVVRPKEFAYCVFDDERGWCWESNQDAPIRPQLYEDQEGILRQPSPLYLATGKNMIARAGIRGAEQRSHFLKAARRSGMTCVLRMTLPRGSAVTSALREAFQFATLDPGAIFHLLR